MLISACAIRLDRVSPAGTDLSGVWILNESASQTVNLQAQGQQVISGGMAAGAGMAGSSAMGGSPAAMGNGQAGRAITPTIRATQMTIEQNNDSMGIEIPNELYRDIDWGKKEFFRETVNAGWQKNTLIVITESEQSTLTETYQINSNNNILTQTISIDNRRGTSEFVRIFDRKNP